MNKHAEPAVTYDSRLSGYPFGVVVDTAKLAELYKVAGVNEAEVADHTLHFSAQLIQARNGAVLKGYYDKAGKSTAFLPAVHNQWRRVWAMSAILAGYEDAELPWYSANGLKMRRLEARLPLSEQERDNLLFRQVKQVDGILTLAEIRKLLASTIGSVEQFSQNSWRYDGLIPRSTIDVIAHEVFHAGLEGIEPESRISFGPNRKFVQPDQIAASILEGGNAPVLHQPTPDEQAAFQFGHQIAQDPYWQDLVKILPGPKFTHWLQDNPSLVRSR